MPSSTLRADDRTGVDYLEIPAGEFRMGDPDEDFAPPHTVRLTRFWMARTEITREQYLRFMRATGRPEPAQWRNDRLNKPGQPVIGVNWHDAAAYCDWAGGRLPSEAEWEYAARGTDGRRFPWGSTEPDATRAVFHLDIGFHATRPVGGCPAGASPFGLLDMAGNALEWCHDWYAEDYYQRSPRENPRGPAEGRERVVRGGGWISLPDALACARRGKFPPDSRSTLVGFRVVRDTPPGSG